MGLNFKDYINKPITTSYNDKQNLSLKEIAACRGESTSFFVRAINNIRLFFKGKVVNDEAIAKILESEDHLNDISDQFKKVSSTPTSDFSSKAELKQLKNDIQIAKDLAKIFNETTGQSKAKEFPLNELQKTQDIVKGQLELKKYDPADLLKAHLYNQSAEVKQSEITTDFINFLVSKNITPSDPVALKDAYKNFIRFTAEKAQKGDAEAVEKMKRYQSDKPLEFYFIAMTAGNPHVEKFAKLDIPEAFTQVIITKHLQELLGSRKITDYEHNLLNELISNPQKKQEFNEYLKIIKPEFKDGSSFLIKVAKDAIQLRSKQLELHAAGKNALSLHKDIEASSLCADIMLIQQFIAQDLINKGLDHEMSHVIRFTSNILENIFPMNIQIITDKFHPDLVMYLTKNEISELKPKEKETLRKVGENFLKPELDVSGPLKRYFGLMEEANKREGDFKGFALRNQSNISQRNDWEILETTGDNIFRRGNFKVTFIAPDGTRQEAKIPLDLSTLGNLTRGQVFTIFNVLQTELNSASPSVENITKQAVALNVDEKTLISIIQNFNEKVNNEFTFALIMANHAEKKKPA